MHALFRQAGATPRQGCAGCGALAQEPNRAAGGKEGRIAGVVVDRFQTGAHHLLAAGCKHAALLAAGREVGLHQRRVPRREERHNDHRASPLPSRSSRAATIDRTRMRVAARSTISSILSAVSDRPRFFSTARAWSTVTASRPHPNE